MAATKFQKLQKAATGVCLGKTTITAVKSLAKEYVKDATEKGATKAAAEKTANRQIARAGKCSKIGATKKRKTTATKPKAKKTTKRK
jgi:hypothetical protein